MDSFLARFGNSRGAAEQIVSDASNAPHRLSESLSELNQLYMVNVGSAGLEECSSALFYAIQLQEVLHLRNSRESLPVSEIEQSNVQDTDSSVGMSEDTSNTAMGPVDHENEAGSTGSMDASNTLTGSANHGDGVGSVESMDITSDTIVGSAHRSNEAGGTAV